MSANNGIYILKTGKQYRVAQIQGIDRLYCDDDGHYHEDMIPKRVIDMFNVPFTYDAGKAIGIACAMNDLGDTEYGIVLLNTYKTWKQILGEANES